MDNERGRKRFRGADDPDGYYEDPQANGSPPQQQQHQFSAPGQSGGLPLQNYAYVQQYYRQLAQQQQQNDLVTAEAMAARNRAQILNNPFLGTLGVLPSHLTGTNMNPLSRNPQNWPPTATGASVGGGIGQNSGVTNRNLLLSAAVPPNDNLYPNAGNVYRNSESIMYAPAATAAQSLASLYRTDLQQHNSGAEGEYKTESGWFPRMAAAFPHPPQATFADPPPRRHTDLPDAQEAALLCRNTTASGRNVKLLYMPSDDDSISPYQRFARMQIELFEAEQIDVDTGAQGRNKPVVLGQVGIRCIHCADLPPKVRTRAAVYYPSRLTVLYQAAQNIVNVHLPQLCESIPDETREKLVQLDNKRSSVGGGKNYWSDCAQIQGVIDTPNGLRFRDNLN